ncbi:uncharacterized protein LOC116105080 [Pistacia vera]|uniref:uncharacterized protein LOC116105080 n=1 Tax=Pistacia vera TaxID=55513 RepID=UPI001262DD68|nr:uncharacterized protein LOC116105080 [Pistacia vera]
MLYLLVVHPAMVSIGLAQTSFQDISAVVRDIASPARGKGDKRGRKRNIDKTAASKRLADSCFLGLEGVLGEALEHIQKMTHEEKDLAEKWNKIGCIWLEILAFTASKCKGRQHGQQLRSGGEFLTHVWLLMAHFGLTDHFLQPNKQEIVRLIAK